jgi:hypothetical protein
MVSRAIAFLLFVIYLIKQIFVIYLIKQIKNNNSIKNCGHRIFLIYVSLNK